ncbi:hypothetical protein DPEC_G00117700 [Dallia pectoralis]|uniref:Uncharacterized protein n=1 Tax=Dallia pectoralis TaxID=75939 RepID=A0ACC2GV11_DALPE|nr:hypothetical protein DPEC_G00117700 [Dallia pectoralis]
MPLNKSVRRNICTTEYPDCGHVLCSGTSAVIHGEPEPGADDDVSILRHKLATERERRDHEGLYQEVNDLHFKRRKKQCLKTSDNTLLTATTKAWTLLDPRRCIPTASSVPLICLSVDSNFIEPPTTGVKRLQLNLERHQGTTPARETRGYVGFELTTIVVQACDYSIKPPAWA